MMSSLSLLAAVLCGSSNVPSVPYQWRSVAVGAGGFVSGVIVHPRAKNIVYCRTDIGGAYRLDPRTRRWIPLQDWLPRSHWNWYGVESLALDPSDPRKVYIAAGTYTNEWGSNGAILRSRDQGRTWAVSELPFKNGGNEQGRSIGERLAVDPNDGRILFFGTRHEGLWKSADSGASWARVPGFPARDGRGGVGIGWVLFDSRAKIAGPTRSIIVSPAIPGEPLYRSSDGGQTWAPVPGCPEGIRHHGELAPDGSLYVTVGNTPGPNGVTDGGVYRLSPSGQWTDITPIKPTAEKGFGYAGLSLDSAHPGTLIVSTLCRWGADTIFRSRDGGKTWISLAEKSRRDVSSAPYLAWGRPEADFGHWIGDCELDPFDSRRAWYVTGATIYETTDLDRADRGLPTRWKSAAEGVEETAVLDLMSPPEGPHLVSALGDIGGFPHFDLGRPHAGGMVLNPLMVTTESIDFAALKPLVLFRAGRSRSGDRHGGYSLDGGRTWTQVVQDAPGTAGGGSAALSADGSTLIWGGARSAPSRSLDWGATWSRVQGLPAGARVLSDRANPQAFYAVDERAAAVYASSDGGRTFSRAGSLPPSGTVGAGAPRYGRMRAVFGREGGLWIPTGTGLYWSEDGGRSFAKAGTLTEAEAVGFGRAAPGARYPAVYAIGRAGRQEGVFRSTDRGRTWVQVNDAKTGFGTMEKVCGDPRIFGRVYIGTNGRGILRADPATEESIH